MMHETENGSPVEAHEAERAMQHGHADTSTITRRSASAEGICYIGSPLAPLLGSGRDIEDTVKQFADAVQYAVRFTAGSGHSSFGAACAAADTDLLHAREALDAAKHAKTVALNRVADAVKRYDEATALREDVYSHTAALRHGDIEGKSGPLHTTCIAVTTLRRYATNLRTRTGQEVGAALADLTQAEDDETHCREMLYTAEQNAAKAQERAHGASQKAAAEYDAIRGPLVKASKDLNAAQANFDALISQLNSLMLDKLRLP